MTTFGPFLAFIRLWVEAIIVRPVKIFLVALSKHLLTLFKKWLFLMTFTVQSGKITRRNNWKLMFLRINET